MPRSSKFIELGSSPRRRLVASPNVDAEDRVCHTDLLIDGEMPKISDFGISRFGELDSEVDPEGSTLAAAKARGLTATGMLLGTPNYMAPEAVRGGRVEAPADAFAFGILAMEMLTGSTPVETPGRRPTMRALRDVLGVRERVSAA